MFEAVFLGQVVLKLGQEGPRFSTLEEMRKSRDEAAKGIEEANRKAREQGGHTEETWETFKYHNYRWNYFNRIIKQVEETGLFADPHHVVQDVMRMMRRPGKPPPSPPVTVPEIPRPVPTGGGITQAPPITALPPVIESTVQPVASIDWATAGCPLGTRRLVRGGMCVSSGLVSGALTFPSTTVPFTMSGRIPLSPGLGVRVLGRSF